MAVRARHPGCHVLGVGFSAGSNALVRYLGEFPKAGGLTAAVSLCNAWDLADGRRTERWGKGGIWSARRLIISVLLYSWRAGVGSLGI